MNEIKYHGPSVVKVPGYSANTLMKLRELTEVAFQSHAAEKFVSDVGSAVAPHYHQHAVLVEKGVRERWTGSEPSDADIAEKCMSTFKGLIDKELAYLKQTKNYEGKKLPSSADAAIRKIMDAWRKGGSMLQLHTVSQCETFARERAKELAADDAAEHVSNSGEGVAVDESGNIESLGLPSDLAAELGGLLADLREHPEVTARVSKELTAHLRRARDAVKQSVNNTIKQLGQNAAA